LITTRHSSIARASPIQPTKKRIGGVIVAQDVAVRDGLDEILREGLNVNVATVFSGDLTTKANMVITHVGTLSASILKRSSRHYTITQQIMGNLTASSCNPGTMACASTRRMWRRMFATHTGGDSDTRNSEERRNRGLGAHTEDLAIQAQSALSLFGDESKSILVKIWLRMMFVLRQHVHNPLDQYRTLGMLCTFVTELIRAGSLWKR
jgi:hypothetical protein